MGPTSSQSKIQTIADLLERSVVLLGNIPCVVATTIVVDCIVSIHILFLQWRNADLRTSMQVQKPIRKALGISQHQRQQSKRAINLTYAILVASTAVSIRTLIPIWDIRTILQCKRFVDSYPDNQPYDHNDCRSNNTQYLSDCVHRVQCILRMFQIARLAQRGWNNGL